MQTEWGSAQLVDRKFPGLLLQELEPAEEKGDKVKSSARVPGPLLQQGQDPLVQVSEVLKNTSLEHKLVRCL